MSWREPLWLLIALFPLLLWGWQFLRQQKQTQAYADAALLPWVQVADPQWYHKIRPFLWWLFWILSALALAGPRLPLTGIQSVADKNILFVLDVSRSMQAQDISPNRLQRAVLEMVEFLQISKTRNQASRIGVVVYAGRPHLLVPPTDDWAALRFYLEKLDTLVLPTRGSDPIAAINKANALLSHQQAGALPGLIVWLTDGDFQTSKTELIDNTVPLYILGLGTEDGDAIPLAQGKWLTQQGKTVRTRLNSALLQKLAKRSGGGYSPVKDDDSDWQQLYQAMDSRFPRKAGEDQQQQWQELFVWALLPALLLLFFVLPGLPQSGLVSILLPAILAMFLFAPQQVDAADLDTQKPAMQAGIQSYRAGAYNKAIRQFSQAVFAANTDVERARALHNLGNSYFQQGDYHAAAQVFRDALRYRKQHLATRQNLALAETVQAALEKRLAAQQQAQGEGTLDGNRLEAIGNDLNWDQDSTKTSGESVNHSASGLPSVPINPAALRHFVSKGLKRLEQQGVLSFAEEARRKQSVAEAQIAMQEMDDNPVIFWKRLFEIEEGFPGSLEKPKTIPGVEPW